MAEISTGGHGKAGARLCIYLSQHKRESTGPERDLDLLTNCRVAEGQRAVSDPLPK